MANDQGIGNTIVVNYDKAVPTKDGIAITIKTPYENVVLNLSNAELTRMQSQHLKLKRELGNDKVFRGHQL